MINSYRTTNPFMVIVVIGLILLGVLAFAFGFRVRIGKR